MKKIEIKYKGSSYFTIIDDEDFEKVSKYTWHLTNGYAVSRESRLLHPEYKQKHIRLHRFIMNYPIMMIDHINGNPLDNRKSNLRLVNASQNTMNSRVTSRNKLQIKGVRFKYKKYEVAIWINNKSNYLGRFTSLKEAADCYDRAAIKHFGQYARLNNYGKE